MFRLVVRSSLICRNTDWSKSKKERKLSTVRDKKRKKRRENCTRGLKMKKKLLICEDA